MDCVWARGAGPSRSVSQRRGRSDCRQSRDSAARGRSHRRLCANRRTSARRRHPPSRRFLEPFSRSSHVRTSPSRNKLAMSSGSNAPRPVFNRLRRGTPKVSEETPMNAKVLLTIVFALLPSLALAQSSDQTKSRANEAEQASAPGKNGNGSDANGAATPGGAESDANATTAPSSKPPSQAQ
jgi:hypothetical protein